ncbi:MAG TPA: response regulator transcription factor [Solirubrobacteraceae bacterium]|nr:response regulator transcription factor [Solirubrobacteraceae bacterium]
MAVTHPRNGAVAAPLARLAARLGIHRAGSLNRQVAESPVRVLIAEDHPVYLQGLTAVIRTRADFALVAEAADGRAALAQIRELAPDVAVLDLRMPRLDGLQVLRAVRRDELPTRILLISAFVDGELVHTALAQGAAGFVSKESTAGAIGDAIAIAARGEIALGPEMQAALAGELRLRADGEGPRLTEREAEILRLLAEGLSSGEIAERLTVGVTTVKTHLRNLYDKLEVSDRAAAVARAMRVGLLE